MLLGPHVACQCTVRIAAGSFCLLWVLLGRLAAVVAEDF